MPAQQAPWLWWAEVPAPERSKLSCLTALLAAGHHPGEESGKQGDARDCHRLSSGRPAPPKFLGVDTDVPFPAHRVALIAAEQGDVTFSRIAAEVEGDMPTS
jgi:hypothetical protein